MKPPVVINLHKAPTAIGRSKEGKTLWATNEHGPWLEVEPATKIFLEDRGWEVDFDVMYNARSIINAALFTIFRLEKPLPTSYSLLSSGQQINRVSGITGHFFDAQDKEAFREVKDTFKIRGIDLDGPLQFMKLVTFSSKEYNDFTINTEDLFLQKLLNNWMKIPLKICGRIS